MKKRRLLSFLLSALLLTAQGFKTACARRGPEFLIASGAYGKPAYLQMALWVFKRL